MTSNEKYCEVHAVKWLDDKNAWMVFKSNFKDDVEVVVAWDRTRVNPPDAWIPGVATLMGTNRG